MLRLVKDILAAALAALLLALGSTAAQALTDETMKVAADRLVKAIQIPTVTEEYEGDDECNLTGTPTLREWRDFHDFLRKEFPKAHELNPETVMDRSLLFKWPGTGSSAKPILLMAHMDVVPVEHEDDWEHDAFLGRTDTGKIWGRGALDDKLSVLGLLEAVERLMLEGVRPNRDVYLAFGHDEERDGCGAKAIAEKLRDEGVELDYVLDEGSFVVTGMMDDFVAKPIAMIGLAEKGYLTVTVTAKVREEASEDFPSHSSTPPPDTPADILARALADLHDNPLCTVIRSPVSDMLEALAPEMSFVNRFAMQNLWLTGPIVRSKLSALPAGNAMIRTNGVVTIMNVGTKENVIPPVAEAKVNYRILPEDTGEAVLEHVKSRVEPFSTEEIEVEATYKRIYPSSPVTRSDTDSYEALRKVVQRNFPDALVVPALTIAATDARVYGEEDTRIAENVFRFLPVVLDETRAASIHGPNEYITVSEYRKVIEFYMDLLRETVGPGALISETSTPPATSVPDRATAVRPVKLGTLPVR